MSTSDTSASGGLSTTVAGLKAHADTDLGATVWRPVTQEQVNGFADITGDHNLVHVDPEFAATTPFRTTIAHGFLTLSLLADLIGELLVVEDVALGINYGLDKVRFPAPVPVGSRIRGRVRLADVTEPADGWVQIVVEASVEVEGTAKPACVATCIFRYRA